MHRIRVIAVGWREEELTLGAVSVLRSGAKIVLRTDRCGLAGWLDREGISYGALDSLYEECGDFEELTARTVQTVLSMAEEGDLVYCVSELTDRTCGALAREAGGRVEFLPGVMSGAALLPMAEGDLRIVSASDAGEFRVDVRSSMLIREIDSPILAGEVKLKLSEHYPEEMDVFVLTPEGSLRVLPLCELDWLEAYDHRVSALIPAVRGLNGLNRFDMDHLAEIMRTLREEGGCPWDREQTHVSLRRYLLEEAYEAVDAIDRGSMADLCDELGDVLFQVVFHADIGRQFDEFDLSDVTTAICRKMIRRHPHVFGGVQAASPEEVNRLWERIKAEEKPERAEQDELSEIGAGMPSLLRAEKLLRKAEKRGFVPPRSAEEAFAAWRASQNAGTLGDLLLALAGEASAAGLESEVSLNEAVRRFLERIRKTEARPNA